MGLFAIIVKGAIIAVQGEQLEVGHIRLILVLICSCHLDFPF